MKILSSLLVLSTVVLAQPALSQKRNSDVPRTSPNASVSQTFGVTDVAIGYGRPSVRGRVVFGELEKFGNVWRTGANEATSITFSTEVTMGGTSIPAGTYGLFTVPDKDKWTVIINKNANQWGAYRHDAAQDLVKIYVKPQSSSHHELLTMTFDNVDHRSARLNIHWGETHIPILIQANTDSIVRANVAKMAATSTDGSAYFQAARAMFSSNFMLEDGIAWANQALTYGESYDKLAIAARLNAAAGRYKEAVQFAERALRADQSKKQEPPVWMVLDKAIVEWKSK